MANLEEYAASVHGMDHSSWLLPPAAYAAGNATTASWRRSRDTTALAQPDAGRDAIGLGLPRLWPRVWTTAIAVCVADTAVPASYRRPSRRARRLAVTTMRPSISIGTTS